MTMTVENQKTKITQTSAVSTDTGTRLGIAREDTVIRDTVSMVDLQIGQEYLLRAELMDTETGEPLENADNITVSAEKTFTADVSDMEIEIEIPLDASALADRTPHGHKDRITSASISMHSGTQIASRLVDRDIVK